MLKWAGLCACISMLAAVMLLTLLTATIQPSQYTVTLINASKPQPSQAQESSSQNTDTGQGNVVSIFKEVFII